MNKNNPHTPIMLREAAGTRPRVYARYEFGVEKSQSLEGEYSNSESETARPVRGLFRREGRGFR